MRFEAKQQNKSLSPIAINSQMERRCIRRKEQSSSICCRITISLSSATIRPDGFPQATTVYYVNDGLSLYFATDPTSQKAGNIKLNNKVSVAITGETENAYKLKALSLSGTVAKDVDSERVRELQILLFQTIPAAKRIRADRSQAARSVLSYANCNFARRLCSWLRQDVLNRTGRGE